MKFMVILHTKDTYFMLPRDKQVELFEESVAFVERHRKTGNCKEIYYTPGSKGKVSIWIADSAEEITLRFLENPMSVYEDAQIYLLSDWDAFVSTLRKIHRQILTKD